MALTKEDLQAIAELTKAAVKEEIEPINSRLDALEPRLNALEPRLDALEQGQKNLEETLEAVKISQMRFEMVHLPKIQAALDGVVGANEKLHKVEKLDSKVENHDNRILALEQVIKVG